MSRVLFSVSDTKRITDVTTAVVLRIGVDALAEVSGAGNAKSVILSDNRREVADTKYRF